MNQGERVREIRETLDMTLEKFGEKLGVGRSAISNIEKGTRNLTEQMSVGICRAFNVNYDYLVYGDGEMFSGIPETKLEEICLQFDCDEYDKRMIEEYLKLSKSDREVLKGYMRKVLGM